MGRDKALIAIGGRPMLARVVDALRPLFGDIAVIGGEDRGYGTFGVPLRGDIRPGGGSLGGIYTALATAACPVVFCVACDMPFLSPRLVAFLVEVMERDTFQAVLPFVDGEAEPLCAVYSKSALPAIEEDLDAGVRRIKSTLSFLRVRRVDVEEMRPYDPDLLTFFNINTPEDVEQAREIVRRRREGTV